MGNSFQNSEINYFHYVCCHLKQLLLILLLYSQCFFLGGGRCIHWPSSCIYHSNLLGSLNPALYSIHASRFFAFCFPCIWKISYQLMLTDLLFNFIFLINFFHWNSVRLFIMTRLRDWTHNCQETKYVLSNTLIYSVMS